MIDQALNFVAQQLELYLKRPSSNQQDRIRVHGLVDDKEQPLENSDNGLLLFVTNIAQDKMVRGISKRNPVGAKGVAVRPDPLYLNISFMVASAYYGEKYLQGLKVLSQAAAYFQSHSVFSPQNTPDMPEAIERLSFEVSDLSVAELGHLWNRLGRSYMPSIHYLMRGITIDAGNVASETLPVQTQLSE